MRALAQLVATSFIGLSSIGLPAATALASEADAAVEAGIWQKHEYSFRYVGFTSKYSCDGLAEKLKLLLLTSGARPDIRSEPGLCTEGFGHPDPLARAELVFYTLAPAASHARGEPGQGRWRNVTFAQRDPMDLQIGDCELVEQFSDEVVKKMFTTRNLIDKTSCIPHQESGSVIDLRFESLAPMPPPTPGTMPPNGAPGGRAAPARANHTAP